MAKLKRSLSVLEVTLMGVGSILGAGVYIIIGEAAGLSGNSLWLSFILAAIVASFTGLSYAELSSRFPHSGAEYVYVENSFGKTAAWLVGWLILVGSIIGGTTVAIGFSYYFSAIFGTPILLTSIFMLFVVGVILIVGVQETASITILFTIIEAAGLIIIIFIGIPYFGLVNYFELTKGLSGLIDASILIFFSYIGFEGISRLAEETKNPKKNIPKAIIYSIIIVTIFYALVGIAAVSIVGWQELSTAKAPLAIIAQKAFGEKSFVILSAIALFATFNTVLFILLSGSRFVYGMAERQALPGVFLLVSKKLKTPWVAIIGIVAASMVFLYIEDLKTVANLTNFAIITVFIVVNASVIYYRYKKPLQEGFRIPISIGKLPVIPFIGIVILFFMIVNLPIIVLLLGIILICLGIEINFFWKWKHQ
jgi:APA family basic amino acid/polyamine antiporter